LSDCHGITNFVLGRQCQIHVQLVARKQSKEKKSLTSNSTLAFESNPKRNGLEYNNDTSSCHEKPKKYHKIGELVAHTIKQAIKFPYSSEMSPKS
jgi:hypothetical protein